MLRGQVSETGLQSRSVAKQIEHWANIGKIAAENPDLSYSLIRELLNTDPEEAVND